MFRYRRFILPVLIIVGWELVAIAVNNEFIIPRLGAIVSILIHPFEDIFGTGSLVRHAGLSLGRVLIGFILGIIVAVPLGIIMGRSEKINEFLDSTIEALRPIPPLAWVPLSLAWFKIGLTSIVFIIFIGAFFPILLNTIDGVKGIKKTWVEVGSTLGANERQTLTKIVLPGASPTIWTGLRVGFGIAWMCVVAAEWLPGTNGGLGYLILYSYNFGQTNVIIAGMIVIGVIGIAVDFLFKDAERRWFSWRSLER